RNASAASRAISIQAARDRACNARARCAHSPPAQTARTRLNIATTMNSSSKAPRWACQPPHTPPLAMRSTDMKDKLIDIPLVAGRFRRQGVVGRGGILDRADGAAGLDRDTPGHALQHRGDRRARHVVHLFETEQKGRAG